MRKLGAFVAFLVLAICAAGIFGMLHDQISYTVSNEYYTKFKFIQFDLLDLQLPDRVRAAMVGFLASWWMGVPLGVLTGVAGFIQPDARQMFRALLWSLLVITAFTLLFALAGLAYGYSQTANLDLGNYARWYIPPDLEHPRNFICVGYMHNCAYLGGLLAIPVAWLFHIYYRYRAVKSADLSEALSR